MIKIVIVLMFSLLLGGCVSKKKFLAQKTSLGNELLEEKLVSNQRIDSLQAELYKAQGGNEMLLIAQQQFQERLIELENQRRQLSGDLSATESRLRKRVGQLNQEKTDLGQSAADLRENYREVIDNFTGELRDIADTLNQDSILSPLIDIRIKSGNLQLFVQEELLFAKRVHNRLLPANTTILQAVVDVLHAYPLLELQIIGHTDNSKPTRGQPENRTFAGLRAATLANELTETYYLSASRVTASSKGDSTPMKSNETEEGRKANRRIEFRVNNSLPTLLRELESIGREQE
jgi:flagellar motor protein MotB